MANMSRLDGVNRMLMSCGVRPVSALDAGGASEAADAERLIDFESRSLQVQGLYDNQVMCVEHTADANGNIVLAATIIAIKAAGTEQHRHFAMRDNGVNIQVYDLDRGTLTFPVGETIDLDLTFEIAFESAAPNVQELILKAATEIFQRQFKGNPWADQQLKTERVRSEVGMTRAVGQTGGVRDNPPPFAPQQPRGQGQ